MKKPITIAAWSGITAIIISLISLVLSSVIFEYSKPSVILAYSIIMGIVTLTLWSLFIYGFISIGKEYKSKFLITISWISIIIFIISLILCFYFSSSISQSISSIGNIPQNPTPEEQALILEQILPLFIYFIGLYIYTSLVLGLISILSGIAFLKIKKDVPYAHTTGVLKIIAGATYFIFIGFIIRAVALVYEFIILFNTAKELENNTNKQNKTIQKINNSKKINTKLKNKTKKT